jgi:hypothetical protein
LHHRNLYFSASPLEDDEDDRGHWGSKAEFILSCVGFSVSLFCPASNAALPNAFIAALPDGL